jgi:RimJ/RimL family protein N-acetyltransferase
MFVRTPRLTLRPGWREDAAALTEAIGHEGVVRNLARVPWPYREQDASDFLSSFDDPLQPTFLIFEHRGERIQLVGGIGIGAFEDEPHELGYWLTPAAWGRGIATEAGRGVINAAHALGVRRISARPFVDNPQSGRVLRKLGFRPTGRLTPVYSRGRGCEVQSVRHVLELTDDGKGIDVDPEARMAA